MITSKHIHILSKSATGQLSSTIRDFKKFTGKAIVQYMFNSSTESRKEWMLRLFYHAAKRQNKAEEYPVWTIENHAKETTSNAFIESKVEYIHENQVSAAIVRNPEHYIYSIASVYAGYVGRIDTIPNTFRVKTMK